MDDNLLKIENLRVSFFTPAGEVKALNDVTYSMKKGEVLGIVGESGSGKSVSAYSILGLLPYPGKVLSGSITFMGQDITHLSEKEYMKIRGKDISIIFQDPLTCLNPLYTVGNQITEVFKLHTTLSKKEIKDEVINLLDLVGINEPEKRYKQYPYELSGGMRQRVMIAMALACKPKLLIADEPTTALDTTIQAQILELMEDLKSKFDMGIIMITHDLGVIAKLCDRIAVMYAGHIVEMGSAEDIFYNPKHEYTKGLLKSIPNIKNANYEKLVPIEGQAVDMLNLPKGCAFASRCPKCMKVCLDYKPAYSELNEGHKACCFMNEKEKYESKIN